MASTVQPDGDQHQRQISKILEAIRRHNKALQNMPGFRRLSEAVEAPWKGNIASNAAKALPNDFCRSMLELGWECQPLPGGIDVTQKLLWLSRGAEWFVTKTTERLTPQPLKPRFWDSLLCEWDCDFVQQLDLHEWVPTGRARGLAVALRTMFDQGVEDREAQVVLWKDAGRDFENIEVAFGPEAVIEQSK